MFLCEEECHPKSGCKFPHFMGSRGPCEDCGKTRACFDCREYKTSVAPITEEAKSFVIPIPVDLKSHPDGDGTHRLCMELYDREDPAVYIGGANAPMLHDAADRLIFYKKFVEAVQIYMATQGLAIHRFEDAVKVLALEDAGK